MSVYTVSPRFVVQFPHPGGEHRPGNTQRQPWNTGDHRRKFLKSRGRCINASGRASEGDLVFWGEWEGPSYIVESWKPKDALPRFLHRPVWEFPETNGARQNTDPWVFGDSFKFSNCKQLTPRRNRSSLQSLTPGSLILFGSTIGVEFVLDTALVVKGCSRFSPGDPPDCDEAFRICTVESLLTSAGRVDDPLTLYHGATYEAPINAMYSFVPCRPARAREARFARPSISLPFINPRSTQTPSGVKTPRSEADVREAWNCVRKQVLDAGCLLGVWFSTPQFDMKPCTGMADSRPME